MLIKLKGGKKMKKMLVISMFVAAMQMAIAADYLKI